MADKTNAVAAPEAAESFTEVKTYKNPFNVRRAKAEASTACRKRKEWLAKNPNATEADLPADLQRKSPARGNRTIDESDMTPEDVVKLNELREAKKIASRECIARKKWLDANPGKTKADLPDHLQVRPRAKKAEPAASADAAAPKAAKKPAKAAAAPDVAEQEPQTAAPKKRRAVVVAE